MVDAVLADAGRFSVTLPRPAEQISEILNAQAPVLAEVRTPVLVHFDLWEGNILVGPPPPAMTAAPPTARIAAEERTG